MLFQMYWFQFLDWNGVICILSNVYVKFASADVSIFRVKHTENVNAETIPFFVLIFIYMLLQLYTPLDLDNITVAAVPIQSSSSPAGSLCTVSGWGQTKEVWNEFKNKGQVEHVQVIPAQMALRSGRVGEAL